MNQMTAKIKLGKISLEIGEKGLGKFSCRVPPKGCTEIWNTISKFKNVNYYLLITEKKARGKK